MLRDIPVLEPIDRILNCVYALINKIFYNTNNGYMRMLVNTIVNNPLLLITCCLMLLGFVIGVLKRMINV